jgi:hypothetical protein
MPLKTWPIGLSVATFVLSSSLAVSAQEAKPLNDQRIVDLVSMGVSQTEIIRMISVAQKFDFDLRPESTDAMLKHGVSEDAIKAMAARNYGHSVTSPAGSSQSRALVPAPQGSTQAPSGGVGTQTTTASPRTTGMDASSMPVTALISEVGVYYQSGGQYLEMMPELVNWQTGGVLKSVVTAGIVKGDVNGRIRFGRSHIVMPKPIRLLVYTPEGTQITEYQLIRLHTHSDSREFRTVTGGVLHVSGGSKRDDLPFEGQHVSRRTWTIALDNLQPGEYGLLPSGAIEARSASAQLGKMYTFTVAE